MSNHGRTVYYYTTPGLSWDAALRMSRVDLQLITDVEPIFLPFPIRMIPAFQPESHLSGRKQFLWVGNVLIYAHSWISFSPAG